MPFFTNRMKLLMLSVDPRILERGSAVQARTLAYGSIVDKLDVIVYTKPGHSRQDIAKNVSVYPTNTRFKLMFFKDAYHIAKRCVDKDTVITSQDGITNFLAVFLKWRFRVPLQVQVHTDFMSPYFLSGFKSILHYVGYRLGMSYADCIRVVSERTRRSVVGANWRPKQEPLVLPIFSELQNISNSPIDLHRLYPQFNQIIIMASRLSPEKNIPLALHPFAGVASLYPKAGLIIVGGGPEEQKLKSMAKVLNIESQVAFEKWQDGGRLASYYATADAYLLSSNYEGYGLSLIEAAFAGCPIISTDVGAIGDVISRDNVLHVSVGDKDALKQCLRFALNHPDEMRVKALKAQAEVRQKVISSMDEYLRAYKAGLLQCVA